MRCTADPAVLGATARLSRGRSTDGAKEVLAALRHTGVTTLSDGAMVDAAMARRARRITKG